MNNSEDVIFVLLSVGSNLGKRKQNILQAFEFLKLSDAFKDVKISSFYETEPFGVTNQPWFINAAITAYTTLPLNILIQLCKSVEYILGRKIRKRWCSREIDIDIIFYGDYLVDSDNLTIPHSQMHKRRFVLEPAAELAGNIVHPGFKKSINQLLEICEDNSIVRHT